jgi:hypothetical protein
MEESFKSSKVSADIASADSENHLYSGISRRELIPPREPTVREEPKPRLEISDLDEQRSSLTNFELGGEFFYHKYKEPGIMEQSGYPKR